MTPASTPSWLRFSLRALLVVITILCCWLGWETSVVRARKKMRTEASTAGYHFQTAGEYAQQIQPLLTPVGPGSPPPPTFPPTARVSFVRRVLGDEAIQTVWYYGNIYPQEKFARLQKTFPEARFDEVLPEPCHPGCFPAGTLVETQNGPREIETIVVGDVLNTVLSGDEMGTAAVQSIFVTQNLLWEVETEDGTLVTTETQPLCLADGSIRQVGKIEPGEKLRQWREGNIRDVEVLRVKATGKQAKVFNVILGDSEIFIAGGFLARSKPPELAQKP